jgi:hypothetical protein
MLVERILPTALKRLRTVIFVLPPQDTHLMSKANELEFQAGAATNAEGEGRNQGRKNRHHAHDRREVVQKFLGILSV